MPIVASDISMRRSGGATNVTPESELGGAMSTVAGGIANNDLINDMFNDFTSAEALVTDDFYRGRYYDNEHGTLQYTLPFMWISSQTSSGNTDVAIGLAPEAKNLAIAIIGTELIAPASVTFSAPASKGAGIAFPSLNAGDNQGWWLRYHITAPASAVLDTMTLAIEGDSLP